ncbi:3-hydroxyacyl-CoA dehydrogenase NAD-binding domain-containing protein [Niallia sp. 03133]|uniref:3-hydroxyacyl-CoA dehydrogenase NAD-binding domain-containing protein n=1 Tax=Niallia sp. 03133 TaxID=3458060 RepID=UPI004044B536
MASEIKYAAVIGAGVMGSAIAAQLVNVNIPTLLLDIVPNQLLQEEIDHQLTLTHPIVRNRYVDSAKKNLVKMKPSPIVSNQKLSLLETGNIEDNFDLLSKADWIIEAITEDIEEKKTLFTKIDKIRKTGSIISSNTSGISIEEMMEDFSEDFQTHFFGTHFFNPPRYIRLLEIIPSTKTNPAIINTFKNFAEEKLGKVVIMAKDTPNFIANRLGGFAFLTIINEMIQSNRSIYEVDQLTGPFIGFSKSGTFQTLDMVGLDTFSYVIQNMKNRIFSEEEKDIYKMPPLLQAMLSNNMLGRKSGRGFYKKTKDGIQVLDYQTMQYIDIKKEKKPSNPPGKLKDFLYENSLEANFIWNCITPILVYTASLVGKISDSIYEIDEAVKTGFNWRKGPFETWDVIGIQDVVKRLEEENTTVPNWINEMIDNGFTSFYKEEKGTLHYYKHGRYEAVPKDAKRILVKEEKEKGGLLHSNNSASLIDIGDGVALLELHTLNNAIGMDALEMIEVSVEIIEKNKNYRGLVIGSTSKNFSVGANIALLLLEAQSGDKLELEMAVNRFQQAMKKIKYCIKPIVAAPSKKTLGGGAEICLAASQVQALQETYIGLVETAVGLVPGGGGTKELYINRLKYKQSYSDKELMELVKDVFYTVLTSNVSTSAENGKELGFLEKVDNITINDRHLLYDAKQQVLLLEKQGYLPPKRNKIMVAGTSGYQLLMSELQELEKIGKLAEYDLIIAKKLAFVLTGGNVDFKTEVEEDYLLSLEKEAFLSLIQQKQTQDRILHLLQTGKIK